MIGEWVARGRLVLGGAVLGTIVATVTAAHAAPIIGQPCSVALMPTPTFTGRTVTDPHTHVRIMASSLHFVKNVDPSHPNQMVALLHILLQNTGHKAVQTFSTDLLLHGVTDAADYDGSVFSADLTIKPLQPTVLLPGQKQAGDLSILVPVAAQKYELHWRPADILDSATTPYFIVPVNK